MTTQEFLIFYVISLAVMLACRCVPMLALKGRQLSPRVTEALGMIPAAAYAALVANDLLDPTTLVADPLGALLPLLAAAVVLVVARKTGSLIGCALTGMAAYALLSLVL